jgi:SWI/SNF-related matrix-associated actin-dependent regulator of chromatin subfamily B member 1
MAAPTSSTSTAVPGDVAPVASDADAGPSLSASSAPATAADDKSKSGSPHPASHDLPIRDKDSLDKVVLERFIYRDNVFSSLMVEAQKKDREFFWQQRDKIEDYKKVRTEWRGAFPPSSLYGEGYRGYGNGFTEYGGPAKIVYPMQRQKPGKKQAPPLKYTKKDMTKQAEQHEELVPVRLDIDWDKVKLRDTFTWNLHERIVPPELFAAHLVEDVGLEPPLAKPVFDQAVAQIREQLNDFYPFAYSDEDALDPELPYSAYKNDEMRILVKLNITIGPHTLVDQFEWEINNPINSPEEFAANLAKDLSLSGEFTTAIAHCIREQTQLFTRSLYSVGHPFDGRPVDDADLIGAFLPSPLPTVFRPQQQAKEYAPYLYELNEAELERNEVIFSREQRRQKRSVNRRGGPQLPDLKERQRTIRTLIVSSVLPGAALDIDDSKLYKRATGAAAPSGRGRRGRAGDGDLSDSEESDESGQDSPAPAQLQGTARTRGMRGAASAAQQRMQNLGRSETPEAVIHHHETRTNLGFGRGLTRERTEEVQTRVVTFRVSPLKLRRLLMEMRRKRSSPSRSATPSGQSHIRGASINTPGPSAMKPPSTPSQVALSSVPPKTPLPAGQVGRVPAPPPPAPGEPTPTPVSRIPPPL